MKGIKVKFYQKTASFKEPIMNGSILTTHPLPPYSTVIGMIHNCVNGRKHIELNFH